MGGHSRREVLKRDEVNDEVVLHGEDGVGREPWVVLGVDLRDDGLVLVVGDHEVDVGGAHGVAVDSLQELPGRTVLGEGVGGGTEAVEAVLAVLVRLELAAEVVVGLVARVLEVVLAVAAGLPEVEGHVGDGFLGLHVADDAVHVGDDAVVLVLDD